MPPKAEEMRTKVKTRAQLVSMLADATVQLEAARDLLNREGERRTVAEDKVVVWRARSNSLADEAKAAEARAEMAAVEAVALRADLRREHDAYIECATRLEGAKMAHEADGKRWSAMLDAATVAFESIDKARQAAIVAANDRQAAAEMLADKVARDAADLAHRLEVAERLVVTLKARVLDVQDRLAEARDEVAE